MRKRWKKGIAAFMAAVMMGGAAYAFPRTENAETYVAAATEVQEDMSEVYDAHGQQTVMQADTAQSYSTNELQPDMSGNLNYQDYSQYGDLVTSYLAAEEGGYMRVQFVAGNDAGSLSAKAKKDVLVVEYYDEQLQLKSQQYINEENKLESLAGFYAGSDYYYVVWKQNLDEETWSANQVFMRVIKYDKQWQIQGFVNLTSDNCSHCKDDTNGGVVYPCEAGSLRMTEFGGHLYINSCYKGVDGHQRSMMYDIVESNLSLVQTPYALAYYYAWVSHSFNQYLLIDEEMTPKRMVTLNHGDGGDNRGAALGQYELCTEYKTLSAFSSYAKEINAFKCAGQETLSNYTGASFGGLERSASSYLVAGNSADQTEENWVKTPSQRNIFVTATSREDVAAENTKVYWLTDYSKDAGVEISTPQLVKMSDTLFLVMWREGKQNPHEAGKLAYTFVDADGRPLSGSLGQTKTAVGEITDCKPVVKDGKAVWYSSSEDEGVYFYTIDSQGTFEAHGVNVTAAVPAVKQVELQKNGVYLEWEPVDSADGYCIVRNIKNENTGNTGVEVVTNYQLTYIEGGSAYSYLDTSEYVDGFPYEYRVCSYKLCNGRRILSYGCDKIERWLFKGVQNFSAVENVSSGVKLSWKPYNPYFNPSEFRIYRSRAGGSDAQLIGTVKGSEDRYTVNSVESFIDTTAEAGVAYDYSLETHRGEGVSARFNTTSFVRVETPKVSAVCNPDNTVTVSWSVTPGAETYFLLSYVWSEARQEYVETEPVQNISSDRLSCMVSGLAKGTKYQFGVIGQSEFIQTPSMAVQYAFNSEEAKVEVTTYENPTAAPTATPGIALKIPSFTSVENDSKGVKLTWNPVEGADGYEVSCYDSINGSGVTRKVTQSETECIDRNVTESITYTYRVRAYVQNGGTRTYSSWSAERSIVFQKLTPTSTPTPSPASTPTQAPTSAPTSTSTPIVMLSTPSISAIKNTEDGVELTWKAVAGAESYNVYYYDQEQPEQVFEGESSTPEFLDRKAEEGKTYCYYIRAWTLKNGILYVSKMSSTVSIQYKNPSPADSLEAPVLNSISNSFSGVKLMWTTVEGADGYYVCSYEVNNPDNIFEQRLAGGNLDNYLDPYSEHGKTYCYYVRAYRMADGREENGKESVSAKITVSKVTPTPTYPPTGFQTPTPSIKPSQAAAPSNSPGYSSTPKPSGQPAAKPSGIPTGTPGVVSTGKPGSEPSGQPTVEPSGTPTGTPSGSPSIVPTNKPSGRPEEAFRKIGDINGDTYVDLGDAQMALRAALRIINLSNEQRKAADVDYDNEVTLTDAQMILRAALRIINLQ